MPERPHCPFRFDCFAGMDKFVVKRSRGLREDSRLRHWMQGKMLIMAALRSRCGYYIFVLWFLLSSFSSPNLSGRRVHVYHTYLIAAIVMTLRVLEGHPHIARIFKCDFRILARLMVPLHLQSFLYSMSRCGVGFSGSLSGDCLLYTSPSPRDGLLSRMPSSA